MLLLFLLVTTIVTMKSGINVKFYAVTIWPAAGQIASPSRKRYLTGRRSNSLKYYQMLFGRLHICKLNSKTRTLFDRLPVIL